VIIITVGRPGEERGSAAFIWHGCSLSHFSVDVLTYQLGVSFPLFPAEANSCVVAAEVNGSGLPQV